MDKRINYKMVIDTETCPLDKDLKGVYPQNMFVYDVGYAVVDKQGTVYKTGSFVNADIYIGEKELMKSAYYASKIPSYEEDLKQGTRKLATLKTIRQEIVSDMHEYDIKEVYAHNMRFDYGTLNNTQRYITKSKYRYFFPYGTEICDTLRMARDVIACMPTYKKFCNDKGYLTKTGRVRMTAEILYKFISGNENFSEAHTGLEDVMIEKDILAYCYKQHKKMNRSCFVKHV